MNALSIPQHSHYFTKSRRQSQLSFPRIYVMASRVSGRFAPPPLAHVDLPAGSKPQVVDADGFEITNENLVRLASVVAGDEDAEVEEEEMEVDEEEEDGDVEPDEEAAEEGEPQIELEEPEAVQGKEPLLSLAER